MFRNSLIASAFVAFSFNLTAHAQIVADGGFELGSPSPVWDESSTNFGSPICNTMQCGTFFGKPFEGDWWAWFGGSPVLEIGMLSQEVTIATGTATLIFQLDITQANGNGTDFLTVKIDGVEVFTVLESEMNAYHPWTEVAVDISSFADGGTHVLSFESTAQGAGGFNFTNFYVDAVEISVEGGPPIPTTTTWGLIVMTLLSVGCGAIMFGRRHAEEMGRETC
ncbi:MAG: hypothetical protein IID36_06895 [Planctomycetes bacterium]|nr:hypothetical protein [Planctomycetota bacterium]